MPIGALLGGLISAGGASAAGATASNAGNLASQSLINAGDAAAKGAYQNAQLYQPWIDPGLDAYGRLNALASGDSTAQGDALKAIQGGPSWQMAAPQLGVYGAAVNNQNEANKQYYDTMGLGKFETSPGYQFRLDQGRNALANSGSARGMTLSGAQAKAYGDYNQGSASAEYGNWADKWKTYLQSGSDVAGQYGNYARSAIGAGQDATNAYTGLNSNLANMGYSAAKGQIDTNMAGNDYSWKGYAAGMPAYQQGQNALANSQDAAANAIGTGVSKTLGNVAGWAGYAKGKGWV